MVENERYKTDAILGQEKDNRIGAARIIAQKTPQAPASMMRAAIGADRADRNIDGSQNTRLISDFKLQVSEFKNPIPPASEEAVVLCVKTRERRAEALLFAFSFDGRSAGHYTQKEANAKFKIRLFQRGLNFDLNYQLLNGSGMNIACMGTSIFESTCR